MKREVTIGIEIHCELKTNTKMFSGAPVGFADAPNTNTNEIDFVEKKCDLEALIIKINSHRIGREYYNPLGS